MYEYKALLKFTIVLGFIAFLFTGYNMVMIYTIIEGMININSYGIISLGGYIAIFLFSVIVFINYMIFSFNSDLPSFGIAIFLINFLSLISLLMQKILYDQVGREFVFRSGFSLDVLLIYVCLILNMLCIFIISRRTFNIYKQLSGS